MLERKERSLDRFAKLKVLARPGRRSTSAHFDAAMAGMGAKLRGTLAMKRIQVDVRESGLVRSWNLTLLDGQAKVARGGVDRPDVRFGLSETDAVAISSGSTSPARVYLEGRLLVSGDCRLARRIYATLAARGEVEIR